MSDHEFEKQVQQKLGELRLRPSDTVWMEVEKTIRTNKRRRRIIWLWLPLLFVCISTSGYILYRQLNSGSSSGIAKSVPATKSNTLTATTNNNNSNPINNYNTSNSTQNNRQTIPVKPVKENEVVQPAIAETNVQQSTDDHRGNITSSATEKQTNEPAVGLGAQKQLSATTKPAKKQVAHKQHKVTSEESDFATGLSGNNRLVSNRRTNKTRKAATKTTINRQKRVQQQVMVQDEWEEVPRDLVYVMPSMVNQNSDHDIATGKAVSDELNKKSIRLFPDSLSKTNTAGVIPIQRKRSNTWHWGVEADAGYSHIATNKLFQFKDVFGFQKSMAEDLSRSSSVINSPNNDPALLGNINSGSNPNAVVKKASPIESGFAFSAGVFAEKIVSPRFRISMGLRYAYMSVNTVVGNKVQDTTLVNIGANTAALVPDYYQSVGVPPPTPGVNGAQFNQGAAPVIQTYEYRYTYQLIEIPLMTHWQMNKGRKLPPLVLDGGFVLSHLVAVNALHYEGIKGIYYKNDSLFNKTQLSVDLGFSVGLLQRSKHPLWIGPHVRYALTGLVDKSVSKGQYLLSTGITVRTLLGRL
jgi:hypothetical protein